MHAAVAQSARQASLAIKIAIDCRPTLSIQPQKAELQVGRYALDLIGTLHAHAQM